MRLALFMMVVLLASTELATRVASAKMDSSFLVVGSGATAVVVLFAVGFRAWVGTPDIYIPPPNSLTGKTIVVADGTVGLGLETAKRLAVGGARIIFTARNTRNCKLAFSQVRKYVKSKGVENENILCKAVDFEHIYTVRDIPPRWEDVEKIDVLINGEGTPAVGEREYTVDGLERHMQANHLGHFVMTAKLLPKLTPNARIINISSSAFRLVEKEGMMNGEELWTPSRSNYDSMMFYRQSKLATILFTQELQRRIDEAGKHWNTVCVHPGSNEDLPRYLIGDLAFEQLRKKSGAGLIHMLYDYLADKFPESFRMGLPEGASTQVWLASISDDEFIKYRGQYMVARKPVPLPEFAKDTKAARLLWEESEERSYTELKV